MSMDSEIYSESDPKKPKTLHSETIPFVCLHVLSTTSPSRDTKWTPPTLSTKQKQKIRDPPGAKPSHKTWTAAMTRSRSQTEANQRPAACSPDRDYTLTREGAHCTS